MDAFKSNRPKLPFRAVMMAPWVLLAAVCIGAYAIGADRISPGGDEVFELTKAMLLSKHGLHEGIPWNDQPILHTWILCEIGKWCSFNLWILRATGLASSLALFLAVWWMLPAGASRALAGVASCLICLRQDSLVLFITPMLEVPAFALALLASGLLMRSARGRGYLMLGCILWALAINIKLTSLIVLPACLCGLVWKEIRCTANSSNWWRIIARATILFGSILFLAMIGLQISNEGGMLALVGPHLRVARGVEAGLQSFDPVEYLFSPFGIMASLSAFLCFRMRPAAEWPVFETVWLASGLCVHSLHHPYWSYYILHMNIPAALLIARGAPHAWAVLGRALRLGWNRGATEFASVLAAMAAFFAVPGTVERGIDAGGTLCQRLPVRDSGIIKQINACTSADSVVFSVDGMYNMHTQRDTIPSIAIRPAKRYWDGAMDDQLMWSIIRSNHPAALVLYTAAEVPSDCGAFIRKNYTKASEEDGLTLYIASDTAAKAVGGIVR